MPEPPDRRLLERAIWEQFGEGKETPLRRAQKLVYRAVEVEDSATKSELARQALAICPDCADAYVVLAEQARTRKEAIRLYREGVAAGERALGPAVFQEQAGRFWGLLETRPYMRARLGLAAELWAVGRKEEAVGHLQEMLRLNPNDNLGVRHLLAGHLLTLDRDREVADLLDKYAEEGTATWAYTRALLEFRRHGDTPETRRLLEEAKRRNPHVPDYLLGRKVPPPVAPGAYTLRDDSEAQHYLLISMPAWKSTLGAIPWVRANDEQIRKRKAKAPEPKGPLSFIRKWLREKLPQQEDVWEADFRRVSRWIRVGGDAVRPWMMIVTSASQHQPRAHGFVEDEPRAALLWDTLAKAMQSPHQGEPHRPTELHVRPDERWESLRPHLEEIGIRLVASDSLAVVSPLLQDLDEQIAGKPMRGLLDAPGVTPEQVGRFFEAAAYFYEHLPWQKVGWPAAIEVSCDRFQSGPWYATVIGQSGLAVGMVLYDNVATMKKIFRGESSGLDESIRESSGLGVMYGEECEVPVADVEAAQRHGWKVARPDAYPWILRKERGLATRPPLGWELELLEGCLRAIPEFLRRRDADDPTPETLTVPAGGGPMTLQMSWVCDLSH